MLLLTISKAFQKYALSLLRVVALLPLLLWLRLHLLLLLLFSFSLLILPLLPRRLRPLSGLVRPLLGSDFPLWARGVGKVVGASVSIARSLVLYLLSLHLLV